MATVRVAVRPNVLDWAIERSGQEADAFKAFAIDAWRSGAKQPTYRQLESFARTARTPFGLLLLDEPPNFELPLPDFRTVRDGTLEQPSADLLDTIHAVQRRQLWFRDHVLEQGHDRLSFVGSVTTATPTAEAASRIVQTLGFTVDTRRGGNWTDTRTQLARLGEDAGILVMIAGYVGADTNRTLDPDEFRGFSIADDIAPAVFVNGRDSVAAQLFTMVHEFAHVWLGRSGIDRPEPGAIGESAIERWCNAVAANVLVPPAELRDLFDQNADLALETSRLASHFRASGLVVLSQLHEIGALPWNEYVTARDEERAKALEALAAKQGEGSTGGDWYRNVPIMVSRRFLAAVLADTAAGGTPPTEAMHLIGSRSRKSLEGLVERYGHG